MPTAKELIDAIPNTGTEALQMGLAAERDGKNRKTVVAAYEDELADRAEASQGDAEPAKEEPKGRQLEDVEIIEVSAMTHTQRRREHLRRNSQRNR